MFAIVENFRSFKSLGLVVITFMLTLFTVVSQIDSYLSAQLCSVRGMACSFQAHVPTITVGEGAQIYAGGKQEECDRKDESGHDWLARTHARFEACVRVLLQHTSREHLAHKSKLVLANARNGLCDAG